MEEGSGGLAGRCAPNFHSFLLYRDVCMAIYIGKLVGRKGSQHWRRVHSGVSLTLTVRWGFFCYQREERVVTFDMRMIRMGVCLDFNLLSWE